MTTQRKQYLENLYTLRFERLYKAIKAGNKTQINIITFLLDRLDDEARKDGYMFSVYSDTKIILEKVVTKDERI